MRYVNVFDQTLVSRSMLHEGPLKVNERTARIETLQEMVSDSKSSGPVRFGLAKGVGANRLWQADAARASAMRAARLAR